MKKTIILYTTTHILASSKIVSSRQIAKLGAIGCEVVQSFEELKTRSTPEESKRFIEVIRKPEPRKKIESNHPFKKYMK